MKFPIASLVALSSVAMAAETPSVRGKNRALKKKGGKKGGKVKSSLSHHNADYQDHYLVSIFLLHRYVLAFKLLQNRFLQILLLHFNYRLDYLTIQTMVS